jgi:hypothetical protein
MNDARIVDAVGSAILRGWRRGEIDAAYAACVDQWIAAAETDDAHLFALHVAKREELYRLAMQNADLSLAHRIAVDLAKLQQQYRTEQRQAATDSKAATLAERIRAKGSPRLSALNGGKR